MRTSDAPRTNDTYEPPQVERVLTPEELAREVQYAGEPSAVTDTATN